VPRMRRMGRGHTVKIILQLKRLRSSWRAVAVACAWLLCTNPALAALIDTGNDSVIDTTSNLEWLDLHLTDGQSVNQALANNPGWSLASDAQVTALLIGAGFSALDNTSRAVDRPVALSLLSLFGCTNFCAGNFELARGFATWSGGGLTRPLFGLSTLPSPTGGGYAAITSLLTPDYDLVDATAGVYLIRVVPEPGTVVLVGLGLVTLARIRRS